MFYLLYSENLSFEEIRQYITAKFELNWIFKRRVRYLRWRYPGSEKVEWRKSRHHGLRRARYWASAGPATRHRRKVGYRHTCLLADWPSLTHSVVTRERSPRRKSVDVRLGERSWRSLKTVSLESFDQEEEQMVWLWRQVEQARKALKVRALMYPMIFISTIYLKPYEFALLILILILYTGCWSNMEGRKEKDYPLPKM